MREPERDTITIRFEIFMTLHNGDSSLVVDGDSGFYNIWHFKIPVVQMSIYYIPARQSQWCAYSTVQIIKNNIINYNFFFLKKSHFLYILNVSFWGWFVGLLGGFFYFFVFFKICWKGLTKSSFGINKQPPNLNTQSLRNYLIDIIIWWLQISVWKSLSISLSTFIFILSDPIGFYVVKAWRYCSSRKLCLAHGPVQYRPMPIRSSPVALRVQAERRPMSMCTSQRKPKCFWGLASAATEVKHSNFCPLSNAGSRGWFYEKSWIGVSCSVYFTGNEQQKRTQRHILIYYSNCMVRFKKR